MKIAIFGLPARSIFGGIYFREIYFQGGVYLPRGGALGILIGFLVFKTLMSSMPILSSAG